MGALSCKVYSLKKVQQRQDPLSTTVVGNYFNIFPLPSIFVAILVCLLVNLD